MYRADSLQIIKAFNIREGVFPVAIQNPYDPLLCNIIFAERKSLYSILINENDLESIKMSTFELSINTVENECYGLSISKHLNDTLIYKLF